MKLAGRYRIICAPGAEFFFGLRRYRLPLGVFRIEQDADDAVVAQAAQLVADLNRTLVPIRGQKRCD